MKVTAILLADHASVREGLLHVIGAGITRIAREPFPARLDVSLALVLQTSDESDLMAGHSLKISIAESFPGGDGQMVASANVELVIPEGSIISGPNYQLPVVVPIQAVPVPGAGVYVIKVYLDGDLAASYDFEVVKPGDFQPFNGSLPPPSRRPSE